MKYLPSAPLLGILCAFAAVFSYSRTSAAGASLQLNPENPHYFLWRGQPTILITSGEHYGAVLNLDFDYPKYLATLAADKLNLTRTFSGAAYFEPQGAFKIAQNTLAPAFARYLAPWGRSDTPGYVHGGNKFDLSRWNPAYFERLRDFVQKASQQGVVVELNLFCPFYEESQWKLSPFNPPNNVNGIEPILRTNVYTLDQHGGLLVYEEKFVRKVVEELRDADNLYYEVCNEPYFGGVTLEWQHHIADVITEAHQGHANPKLISQNIANASAKIQNPDPAVSIFNFHYAAPPETVAMNYGLNKVIGDNETGFRGTNNLAYRSEGWDFILAGGGLFNNLDYSFTVGHEDGTFGYRASQPGGGNPEYRKQLRVLRDFIHQLDFVHMKPDRSVVRSVIPTRLSVRCLVQPDHAYALYLHGDGGAAKDNGVLELDLPVGRYRTEWVRPSDGSVTRREEFEHSGGARRLPIPGFTEDIAMRITRS